jgi:hypothetical protein
MVQRPYLLHLALRIGVGLSSKTILSSLAYLHLAGLRYHGVNTGGARMRSEPTTADGPEHIQPLFLKTISAASRGAHWSATLFKQDEPNVRIEVGVH